MLLLAAVSLLDLSTPEEYPETPYKIFASKDRKKKSVLPMSLQPVEEVNAHWCELEKMVASNPDSGEHLLSAPFNTDTFLPYTRPVMRFYWTTSTELCFGTQMPRFFQNLLRKSMLVGVSLKRR